MMARKTIYYKDELNDDFAGTNIETVKLDENYVFVNKNIFFRIFEFILYYIIVWPLVFFILKFGCHHKYANKEVVKKYQKQAKFIYGNHVHVLGDAFVPNMMYYCGRKYIVVHPDALSIKGIRVIVKMLGALPSSTSLKTMKNLIKAIDTRIEEDGTIFIYPEGHIWPYYTKIRNYENTSFKFVLRHKDVPVFVSTNCFQKRKHSQVPKMITYFDGPFYIDKSLPDDEAVKKLRDEVYNVMVDRTNNYSTYEYWTYIKDEKKESD